MTDFKNSVLARRVLDVDVDCRICYWSNVFALLLEIAMIQTKIVACHSLKPILIFHPVHDLSQVESRDVDVRQSRVDLDKVLAIGW